MKSVEIDANSGFCPGVIRVINKAEEYLDREGHLFSFGAIVHNEEELNRLHAKGLVAIDAEEMDKVSSVEGENLLIRAHGASPELLRKASSAGFRIVDCTCPVVLKLQEDIRAAYARVKPEGGRIILFGKIGHAEVLGLVGQVKGDACVVEDVTQLESLLGYLKIEGPVEVFSQTTMSPERYSEVCEVLRKYCDRVTVHDTICSQVASRHSKLSEFAAGHDVIVFVSGKSSSNGKVLCDLCRANNIRTYHIGSPQEIQKQWFGENDTVGVCGATSTPKWLLEQVAGAINNLQ